MTPPVRIPGDAGDQLAVDIVSSRGIARFTIHDGQEAEPEAWIECHLSDLAPLADALAVHVRANERPI